MRDGSRLTFQSSNTNYQSIHSASQTDTHTVRHFCHYRHTAISNCRTVTAVSRRVTHTQVTHLLASAVATADTVSCIHSLPCPLSAVVMSGVADARARALEIAQRLAAKIGGGPPASSSSTGSNGAPDCKHITLLAQPHTHHALPDRPAPLSLCTARLLPLLCFAPSIGTSSFPPLPLCLPAVYLVTTGCW